jgi:predicted HTH domain antitoxin
MRVELELPAAVAVEAGLTADNATAEVTRMLVLHLYEHGRLSLGKACELAQMTQWEFADLNRELGISRRYSRGELQSDLAKLASV